MATRVAFPIALATIFLAGAAMAEPVKVNAFNFLQAETDTYMFKTIERNGIGVLGHNRTPTTVDDQPVVRMNMDTLYSSGVFDLDAGPVTVTLPQGDGRYMAVLVLSEDHYAQAVFHDGTHFVTKDDVGTRYAFLAVRLFIDPNNPADIEAAHALQDAIVMSQPAKGSWQAPDWDTATLDQTRNALLSLGSLGFDGAGPRMGKRGEVDQVAHLVATAGGWGLNPESEARYVSVFPEKNDGETPYERTLRDVPVQGFWSVTVYDAQGFMPKTGTGLNAINNVTAKPDSDGSVRVQFGNCATDIPNCLRTVPGWNYTIRLYRPGPEITEGGWQPPVAQPMQ